jgi:hypothetical protein
MVHHPNTIGILNNRIAMLRCTRGASRGRSHAIVTVALLLAVVRPKTLCSASAAYDAATPINVNGAHPNRGGRATAAGPEAETPPTADGESLQTPAAVCPPYDTLIFQGGGVRGVACVNQISLPLDASSTTIIRFPPDSPLVCVL